MLLYTVARFSDNLGSWLTNMNSSRNWGLFLDNNWLSSLNNVTNSLALFSDDSWLTSDDYWLACGDIGSWSFYNSAGTSVHNLRGGVVNNIRNNSGLVVAWLNMNNLMSWLSMDSYIASVSILVAHMNNLSLGYWVDGFVLVVGSDIGVVWDLVKQFVGGVSLVWVDGQAKVDHITHKGIAVSVDSVELVLQVLQLVGVEAVLGVTVSNRVFATSMQN